MATPAATDLLEVLVRDLVVVLHHLGADRGGERGMGEGGYTSNEMKQGKVWETGADTGSREDRDGLSSPILQPEATAASSVPLRRPGKDLVRL